MAFVLGGTNTDSTEARFIGRTGGALVALLTGLIGLTTFIALFQVKDSDIPMQIILKSLHPTLGLLMSIIIFAMIFNTAISLFYSAAKRLAPNEKRFKINLVVFTLLGFGLSFFGFKKLMAILYPILGYIGSILVVFLVVAWIKEKEEIKREHKKREKMMDLTRKKLDDNQDFNKKDQANLEKLAESSIIEDEKIIEAVEEDIEEEFADQEEDLQEEIEKKINKKTVGRKNPTVF